MDPVEIENALRLHPGVADAAAWTQPDGQGRHRLVAYLVDRGAPPTTAALRTHLFALLPKALIPARFVHLQAFPLTASGKVDRPALPRPDWFEREAVAPRDVPEAKMLDLFRRVLESNDLGVTDDFFEWGGDSLKAVDLMTRVFENTGIRLPAATLLNAPTVEAMAKEVARGDPGQVMSVWLRKSGDLAPLVCLPGLAADPLWMLPLMSALDPRQPLLGLSFVGLKPPIAIESAASLGVAELRRAQPHGPYFLLGHSLGGVLAFEMARELKNSGDEVAFLGLLDTAVPGAARKRRRSRVLPLGQRVSRLGRSLARSTRNGLRSFLASTGIQVLAGLPVVPGFRDALESHEIRPCALAVTLFRVKDRVGAGDLAAEWAALARDGVEVIDIPGHHFNMLGGANAIALGALIAEAVRRALSSAQSPVPATSSRPGSSSRWPSPNDSDRRR
jgi:thioesterase domain-containing protein/acyl carrier protein